MWDEISMYNKGAIQRKSTQNSKVYPTEIFGLLDITGLHKFNIVSVFSATTGEVMNMSFYKTNTTCVNNGSPQGGPKVVYQSPSLPTRGLC